VFANVASVIDSLLGCEVGFDSVFGYGGQESQKKSRVDILKCWLDTQRGNFTVATPKRQA